MTRLRPYFAWFMLFTTLVIALPRTWIHDCCNSRDEQQSQTQPGSHDDVGHERCQFCDYAPASSLERAFTTMLTVPLNPPTQETPASQVFSGPQVRLSDLRGPPRA